MSAEDRGPSDSDIPLHASTPPRRRNSAWSKHCQARSMESANQSMHDSARNCWDFGFPPPRTKHARGPKPDPRKQRKQRGWECF
jgi:hypothetical protein